VDVLLLGVYEAFARVYNPELVSEDDLKNLSTPDARKMDLFYKGLLRLFTSISDKQEKSKCKVNRDVLTETEASIKRMSKRGKESPSRRRPNK